MRNIFCFIDGQDNLPEQFTSYIEELDAMGDVVYMYTDVCELKGNPNDILYVVDEIISKEDEKVPSIFMSNISNLFQIIYRLYHQVFDAFIYFRQEDVREYYLGGVYESIFSVKISDKEILYKPIYTNDLKFSIEGCKYEVKNYKVLTDPKNSIGLNFSNEKSFPVIRKYYYIDGLYYLFEPVYAEQKIVIYNNENNQSASTVDFTFPGYENLQYMYEYDAVMLNKLFGLLDNISDRNINEIGKILETMEEEMKGYFPFILCMTCSILEDAIQPDGKEGMQNTLLFLTFLLQTTGRCQYLKQLLNISIKSSLLSCENKFFIWNQCKRYLFTNIVTGDSATGLLMNELYNKIYQEYKEKLAIDLYPIRKEDRNDNLIVIFTTQFLSERHAPTRTALERCYTLSKKLGKSILLINTKEQLPSLGMTLVYHPSTGNVLEEYSNKTHYQYKDLLIPYYQPRELMPAISVIRDIIKSVRELKPSFIFCIGGSSIAADLCGKIVPEASIGTVFSSIPTTAGAFSVIGRKVEDIEWSYLYKIGCQKENIIESTFTFELSPRERTITRESFHIPSDKFILVTVGTRLDTDVNEEFIEVIQKTFSWGTHIVFAGFFSKYEHFCSKYPDFKENSTYIGYYDDMLALMEICDLYVNPRRFGGGFSIVEAFHEGTPGVTIQMGDIAVAAGEDFCVDNYEEMLQVIKRYIEDQEFYCIMSQKAIEREKVVTDSASAMNEIISKIQESPLFF